MIFLNKLEEPEELIEIKDGLLEEYISHFKVEEGKYTRVKKIPDDLKKKYNFPRVKELLVKETFGKCAYCESKIQHIGFGDIEHILPKIHRPDLVFDWGNLTLACEQCNRKRKKDYYSINKPLINPYLEEPQEFLIAAGPMIIPKPGNERGYITQQRLELNRHELHERRKEKLEDIQPLIDSWFKAEGEFKETLEKALMKMIHPSNEYSFTILGYFKLVGIHP